MLLLKADRVRFCRARRKIAGEVTLLKAIEYRGRLFAYDEMFEKSQKKEALQRLRDILDAPQDTLPLLVEDARSYTLWCEDTGIAEMAKKAARTALTGDAPQPAAGKKEKTSTIGQLFPTFQRLAGRLRPGQDTSEGALSHQGQR